MAEGAGNMYTGVSDNRTDNSQIAITSISANKDGRMYVNGINKKSVVMCSWLFLSGLLLSCRGSFCEF